MLQEDIKEAGTYGCDGVIFMVFNNFTAEQATDGHQVCWIRQKE